MAAKPITIKVLDKKDLPELFELAAKIYADHHLERLSADCRGKPQQMKARPRIALAEALSWKSDADGRLKLGNCRKVTDLDKQLHGYDFVISIHTEVLRSNEFGIKRLAALLDHEMCHMEVARDKENHIKRDETGKICYRIRKHDLEEFREIVNRHGIWKPDIAAFVQTAIEQKKTPLLIEASTKQA